MYVTSTAAPYGPTNPVPISGDATLNSAGLLTVGANAITTSKIASGAVKTANIDSSAVTTANISANAVTVAKIGASGTPSSATFLRGDGAWATPAATAVAAPSFSGQAVFALQGFPIDYIGMYPSQTSSGTLSTSNIAMAPFACTLANLRVSGYTYAAGSADSITIALFHDPALSGSAGTGNGGLPTGISCTLNNINSAGSRFSCSSANTYALTAGQLFYTAVTDPNGNANVNNSTSPYTQISISYTCQ